jgi:hypothetical protein
MTLVEAYKIARALYLEGDEEMKLGDAAFMRLTRETDTWPGRFGRNHTQLLTRKEMCILLAGCEQAVALEVAEVLKS